MSADGLRRAARTFLVAFIGILLPGLFGWLNALTAWARDEGQSPFPDARSLAYLGVSAIVAGVIAAVNLLLTGIEDATGHGILRTPPPTHRRTDDRGAARTYPVLGAVGCLCLIVAFVAVLLL